MRSTPECSLAKKLEKIEQLLRILDTKIERSLIEDMERARKQEDPKIRFRLGSPDAKVWLEALEERREGDGYGLRETK